MVDPFVLPRVLCLAGKPRLDSYALKQNVFNGLDTSFVQVTYIKCVMSYRFLRPVINFPEFDLVCRLGLQPYRARAGRSKSGPSRQTRSNATFRVKKEILGPKLENYNTLTPYNLNDIGIESIMIYMKQKKLTKSKSN